MVAMLRVPHNKIAVTPIRDPDMIGSIIVPDTAKEREDQGIVKYIGEGVKEIKVGDYVLFSGYTGTMVSIEGEGVIIIMPEEFAVARIDPPDTDVKGLYFRGSDGSYFTATYEMALELMAQAFEQTGLSDRMKMRDIYASRPKQEDYNKLRGG